jgi:hypothetical protein
MDNQLGILDAGKIGFYQTDTTVFDGLFPRIPTGYVNVAGVHPNSLDFRVLEPGASLGIFTGGYGDFSKEWNGFPFPNLVSAKYGAGELDCTYLALGNLNENGMLTKGRWSGVGWTRNLDDSLAAFNWARSAIGPYEERPTGTPDAFSRYGIPYYGGIVTDLPIGQNFRKGGNAFPGASAKRSAFAVVPDGLPLAQDFPRQFTVGIAPVGTVILGFAVEGDNEALVSQGMTLMLERLVNNEVPGDFLSRLIVLPEGPSWDWRNRFYYTRLNGEDLPVLGVSADDAAIVARRNEGQRSVLQGRFVHETGRDDAAAGMDIVLRMFEEADAARAFVDDYHEAFEEDFGFPPDEIDLGEPIPGSNRSRAFLTSFEREGGVRDDALVVVAQVGSAVPVLRFGLLTIATASDARDAFLQDGGGPLAEIGKEFMTEQIRVLAENDIGVHRHEVRYSL